MTTRTETTVSARERALLRELATRVAEIAADPVMEERKRLWIKLNGLQAERPMIITETGGVMDEVIPLDTLTCESEWARGMERGLRNKIFYFEQIGDDTIMLPRVTYGHVVHGSGYGVEEVVHRGNDGAGHGSYVWDAPLKKLPEDLEKLHFRTFRYDAEATRREKERLEDVFGGILEVVNRSGFWWTQGLTWDAIRMIGLEGLMLAMYDQPEGLHALMAFLRDEHLQRLAWFENAGLLTLNNEDDYVGSGGCGYTDALPQPDYVPGAPARIKDLWGLSESQETVGVSPDLFAEFIFPYQLPIISRFGCSCYGCCEPIDSRWHIVKQIPNLRRVSVSPWSNPAKMAEYLGTNYIYSRKPNPSLISTEQWDEAVIRQELRETLSVTKGLNVELVMKDVHTLVNQPDRLGRWVRIAREVIDEVSG